MFLRQSHRGFTLLELMITAGIITIIAAIAYPMYTNWTIQTRRSDAKRHLNRIAALQEKFFTECNSYTATVSGPGTITGCDGLGYSTTSPENHYVLTANPVGGSFVQPALSLSQAYRVSVAPVAGGLQVGDGMFGVDSIGARRWDRDNSGGYDATENNWGK